MHAPLSDAALDQIFRLARTYRRSADALGLDCGPMSGFHNAGVDDLFFAGTAIKSNFLINIGYGNPAVIRPREERYAFDEACRIV
jgi:3-hydroxypropanoate dehydrogenase